MTSTEPKVNSRVWIETAIRDARVVLDEFAATVGELFRLKAEGTVRFARRPPIGLHLIAAEEPRARLTTLPHWYKPRGDEHGRLTPDAIDCELWVETPMAMRVTDVRRISLAQRGSGWRCWRHCPATVTTDLPRALATVRDFVTDARAVLARNRERCCVCNRKLSDELSRSRGVGPECMKAIDACFATTKTIAQ